MSNGSPSTPLSSHSLDTLCVELLSGRAVRLDDGSDFRLNSPEARAAFDWYNTNRTRWARTVVAREDVEAIADRVALPPPAAAASRSSATAAAGRRLHLKTLRAHRFAGLHRFGTVDSPPPDFVYTFDKPFTLIEGDNGTGKTSIVNAVVWCLTGVIYRSQRPPEPANQAVPLATEGSVPLADGTRHVMCPITPLPPREVLAALGDQPLPLDTWVELTFANDSGAEVAVIRRKVQRGPNNSVVVKEPDFTGLGVSEVARLVGTKMPGLIPHIVLGGTSELGKAVAELFGIKPLQDLARHAARAQEKFRDAFRKEREADVRKCDQDLTGHADAVAALVAENPKLDPGHPLPRTGADGAEATVAAVRGKLESLLTGLMAGAGTYLGEGFDHRAARQDLLDQLGPALGAVEATAVSKLPGVARVGGLERLTPEALEEAEQLVVRLVAEAGELSQLAAQPGLAARVRLYARVGGWLKEAAGDEGGIDECPVCEAALDGKLDALTGALVADHLREHLVAEKGYLEKTPAAWAEHAMSVLRAGLPEALLAETRRDPPAHPGDLLAEALGVELFATPCLCGCLSPLRAETEAVCRAERAAMPVYGPPAPPVLPVGFAGPPGGVGDVLVRVSRAVASARWYRENRPACDRMIRRVIGPAGAEGMTAGPLPLHARLSALDQMVKSAAPLRAILSHVAEVEKRLAARREAEERLRRYATASAALEELKGLHLLVENQISSLMAKLSAETAAWKKQLYVPSFTNAPQVTTAAVGGDGTLAVAAAAQGTVAPAQHVSNTSDLRATLLAFLLAFWKHLYDRDGGLSLFLLDEPQESFDRSNRRRIANTLPAVVSAGARVIVTTSSPRFGSRVAAAAGKQLPGSLDHRRVHPLREARKHIVLGPFVEVIEEKRRAFEENENDSQAARDYVKDLRIFLENRLLDLVDSASLPAKPMLWDLVGAVRTRVNAGVDAYTGAAVRQLVGAPELAGGGPFLALLNESHHSGESLITYAEVVGVKDACLRVRKLVEAAHEEYEQWLRRDPREPAGAMPPIPAALTMPVRSVPVLADLAAFTRATPPGEVEETDDCFSTPALDRHAAYVVQTNNFGFAAPMWSVAIVDLSDEEVDDHRLVIALHGDRVYARRLLRNPDTPGFVVLASEAENPSRRTPTLVLPAAEVRLLKVVGILFESQPRRRGGGDEAVLATNANTLGKVEIAFRVRGDSALPMALPGQLVLGGRCLTPEELSATENQPVAISTSAGDVFKRVGKVVMGAKNVRQFESIGGRGESLLVRTEEVDGEPLSRLPLMHSVRHIVGIFYE